MKTIAVDFDGVIHKYSKGWADGTIYDPPIHGAIEALGLLMIDYSVFIFSSRDPQQIQSWLAEQGNNFVTRIIPDDMKFWNERGVIGITQRKLPAVSYIDDRAVKFNGYWSETLEEIEKP